MAAKPLIRLALVRTCGRRTGLRRIAQTQAQCGFAGDPRRRPGGGAKMAGVGEFVTPARVFPLVLVGSFPRFFSPAWGSA